MLRMLFDRYPLLPLAISLIMGILFGCSLYEYVDTGKWQVLFVIHVVVCVVTSRWRKIVSLIMLSAMFLLGAYLGSGEEREKHVQISGHSHLYKAIVASEPVERGKTMRFDVVITEGAYLGKYVKIILLKDSITHHYKKLRVNDGISFYSLLEKPENYYKSRFDYAAYLMNHGIVAQAFVYHDNWRQEYISNHSLPLITRARLKALQLRHDILSDLKLNGLSGDVFAVVSAMAMGDKSSLTKELRLSYSQSGASHVLALSGLHLSIIYALLSLVIFRRKFIHLGSIVLICAIWTYVLLVGMMPSVVRAAFMLSVFTFVGLSGRKPLSLNVLAFAAIIMLLIEPLVIYDIGFQLSFMAVAFIVSFHKYLNCIVPIPYQQRHSFIRWLWQLTLVSFLAQLATIPLVVFYFGNIPVLSLIANLIVIPCTTVILYLTVGLFACMYIPYLGVILSEMITCVVTFLNTFLLYLSTLPFSSINNIEINVIQVVISYAIILISLLLLIIQLKKRLSFNYP